MPVPRCPEGRQTRPSWQTSRKSNTSSGYRIHLHRSPPKLGQFSLVSLLHHLFWRKESVTFSPFRRPSSPVLAAQREAQAAVLLQHTSAERRSLGRHHSFVAPAVRFCHQEQQHLCLRARILPQNSERSQLNPSVKLRENNGSVKQQHTAKAATGTTTPQHHARAQRAQHKGTQRKPARSRISHFWYNCKKISNRTCLFFCLFLSFINKV